MFFRSLSYISSGFVILLALITIIYKIGNKETVFQETKMFPNFQYIKDKIQKINIRFPEKNLTLERTTKGDWTVVNSDNFPADTQMIDNLYDALSNINLVATKTQKAENFEKLSLLNPNETKTINGEGIRFTFFGDNKNAYADFIIGDRLKSYVDYQKVRFFTRYGANGGAYLAEATTDFQYSPSHFLTKQFGIPEINEVVSATLKIQNQEAFKLHRIIDPKDSKAILFMPSLMPKGKKLLYPLVMRDYMVAFMKQMRPVDAMYLPLKKSLSDTEMILELTKGRVTKIIFWNENGKNYMRIIRDDVETSHNVYIYQVAKADYETLIQPLSKFLTDE